MTAGADATSSRRAASGRNTSRADVRPGQATAAKPSYRRSPQRFPLKAVWVAFPTLMHSRTATGGGTDRTASLARIVGRHQRTVQRWQRDGMSADIADSVAVALGRHPGELWPEWWKDTHTQ